MIAEFFPSSEEFGTLKALAVGVGGRAWGLAAAALLAASASPSTSRADTADSAELGHYSFSAFAPGTQDAGVLPPELLRPAAEAVLPTAEPASEGSVEITWQAREAFAFTGYRVTTLMEGAGLDPLVAQWTVDPWSGNTGADPRQRLYRLRLPVLAGGVVRLRTTLEALVAEGKPVLLAVRESLASGERQTQASSRLPRLENGRAAVSAAPPRETAAEITRATERLGEERPTPSEQRRLAGSAQVFSRPEARGPPA